MERLQQDAAVAAGARARAAAEERHRDRSRSRRRRGSGCSSGTSCSIASPCRRRSTSSGRSSSGRSRLPRGCPRARGPAFRAVRHAPRDRLDEDAGSRAYGASRASRGPRNRILRAGARGGSRRPAQALRRRHERVEVGRHPHDATSCTRSAAPSRRSGLFAMPSRCAAAATASPCMAASSPTETSTKQTSGASFMFVMDVKQLGQLHRAQRAGQLGAAAQPALQGPGAATGARASTSRWRSAAPKVDRVVTAHRLRAAAVST